jgi:hypothetical protein
MDAKSLARQWARDDKNLDSNLGSNVDSNVSSNEGSSSDKQVDKDNLPDYQSPQYVISIYSEQRAIDFDQDQETGQTQIEIDHETVDAETLQRYGRDYGISQATSTHLSAQEKNLWFYSVTPREDRAYFEKGIETYYSLHIHTVDDREPQAQDYRQIGALIDLRLEPAATLARTEVENDALGVTAPESERESESKSDFEF